MTAPKTVPKIFLSNQCSEQYQLGNGTMYKLKSGALSNLSFALDMLFNFSDNTTITYVSLPISFQLFTRPSVSVADLKTVGLGSVNNKKVL